MIKKQVEILVRLAKRKEYNNERGGKTEKPVCVCVCAVCQTMEKRESMLAKNLFV